MNNINEWVYSFPYHEMVELNWVNDYLEDENIVNEVLCYFEIQSKSDIQRFMSRILSKKLYPIGIYTSQNFYSSIASIRQGEIQSDKIDCDVFDIGNIYIIIHELKKILSYKAPDWTE